MLLAGFCGFAGRGAYWQPSGLPFFRHCEHGSDRSHLSLEARQGMQERRTRVRFGGWLPDGFGCDVGGEVLSFGGEEAGEGPGGC